MFKKNPNRPPMVISLKKVQGGFKVVANEGHSLFQVKRIIRTMYRPDLVPQGSGLRLQQNGLAIPSTIIQPPSHFTFPAFASWFSLTKIHQIQMDAFPEFFEPKQQTLPFSFDTRNAKLYKYYRNTMVGMWLENVKKHLSAAHCRRTLVGDVSLIVRIHAFLQNWGIVNFPSREHSKGIQLREAERLTCYICQQAEGKVYHVTPIEDVIFQICDHCFKEQLYPAELSKENFVQILHHNYKQTKHRLMSTSQLLRLMDIFSANGGREKEREMWAIAQKQFTQFTREQLVFNFFRVPLMGEMNANIFDNNEDLVEESLPQQEPTIFEDYQNPLQSSIAVAYFHLKNKTKLCERVRPIFEASQSHAKSLALQQQWKVEQLVKMLIDVSYSKLQLKSIFIQEYEKLVEKCLTNQKGSIANCFAESLKQNMRLVERSSEPELLESFGPKND